MTKKSKNVILKLLIDRTISLERYYEHSKRVYDLDDKHMVKLRKRMAEVDKATKELEALP